MVDKARPVPEPPRVDRRDHLIGSPARFAEVEHVGRIHGVGRRVHLADVLAQDGAGGDALEGAHADAFGAVGAELGERVPGPGVEEAGAGGVAAAGRAGVGARVADAGGVGGVGAVGGPAGWARAVGEGSGAVDVGVDVDLRLAFEVRRVDVGEIVGDDPFVRVHFVPWLAGEVAFEVLGEEGRGEAVEAD